MSELQSALSGCDTEAKMGRYYAPRVVTELALTAWSSHVSSDAL